MQQHSIFSRSSLFGGRLLLLWLFISLAWLCALGAGICVKAGDQVAASSDLAREIAQLDCAAGTGCSTAPGLSYGGSQAEVIATYLTYGAGTLVPLAVLPPLTAFLLGVLACALARRLRSPRAIARPGLAVMLRKPQVPWP